MKKQHSLNHVSDLQPGVSSFHQTKTSVPARAAAAPSGKPSQLGRMASLALLAASLLFAFSAKGSDEIPPPLNGAQPRPFYVIGHNPNSVQDVLDSLAGGANALEPDISVVNNCNGDPTLITWDTDLGVFPDCDSFTLLEWCDAVNKIAKTNPQLALVVFDIKPPAGDPSNGPKILDAARNHLNKDGVNLNIIYSVPTTNVGTVFDQMIDKLLPTEGVQVDAEDDAAAMMSYFFNRGYSGNIGYGDGTGLMWGPLTRAADKGAFLRASVGFPRSVSYVYTLDLADSFRHFINTGVDGIIVLAGNEAQLTNIVATEHPELRMATRADNKFQPLNEAYAVEVITGSDGTDADVEFTLHGCRGNAKITVNAGYIIPLLYNTHRFESGNSDWITIPSKDLGEIQSVTIRNLGGGDGPDWELAKIHVSSARYIGANWFDTNINAGSHEYSFNSTVAIPSGATANLTLTPNFALPLPTIQCPAPIAVNNDPNQCGAVVSFSPKVDGLCDDVKAVCDFPSGSFFPIGTTPVTCYATNGSGQQSAPCTFTVTVQDTQVPVITCPAPMVVNATSPAGVVVSFAPTVVDNCPGTVTCIPASGSVFAIGDTSVFCTATDGSANQASCSFNVHVKGAAEQTADLLAAVNGWNLSKAGLKSALLVQLNATLASLQNNQLVAACGSLKSFIDLVDSQRNKAITSSDADYLIAAATQIRAVIGCTP